MIQENAAVIDSDEQSAIEKPTIFSSRLWLGLDVGGTKIEGAAVDDSGALCGQVLLPTDTQTGEHAVESIAQALRALLDDAGAAPGSVAGVGVGIPGKVEEGVVSLAVHLKLESFPLAQVLSQRFGVPVFIENDVRAAALGAYDWLRSRQPVNSMVYLSLGTGISAGVILNGRLHRGMAGMAGEVGHAIIDPGGARCKCGMTGCLETIASGPSIAHRAQEELAAGAESLLRGLDPLTAEHVFAAAREGDALALGVVRRAGWFVSRAIYNLLMNYDVEVVALGGGVSHAGEIFFTPVQEAMAQMSQESPLAAEMLGGGQKVILLPRDASPAWRGMVLLAQQMAESH